MITTSVDGHLKFWKKNDKGIEFVKHFRAHIGIYFVPFYYKFAYWKMFFNMITTNCLRKYHLH
jgi:hypothetical protein